MSIRGSNFVLMTLIVLAIGSCSRAPTKPPPQANQARIVSLSPAISRTLVDLNLSDRIVGRTPYCASLDQSIPNVGDLLNIDYEQLVRLKPTHLLVQPPDAGVDRHLIELAGQHGWKISQWGLNSINDIETMIREIPSALFADGSTELDECAVRSADILNQMAAALSPGAQPVFRGRTLVVYSLSPVSVFGAGTYLDDVLRSLGGTNAVAAKGWASISMEDLVRLNPEAIIIVKPGATDQSMYTASGPIWELDMQATNERRVGVLTHPDAFLPSSGVIGVAAELRAILEKFQTDFENLHPN